MVTITAEEVRNIVRGAAITGETYFGRGGFDRWLLPDFIMPDYLLNLDTDESCLALILSDAELIRLIAHINQKCDDGVRSAFSEHRRLVGTKVVFIFPNVKVTMPDDKWGALTRVLAQEAESGEN